MRIHYDWRMTHSTCTLLAALAVAALPGLAAADSFTLYAGRGSDTDLIDLPGRLLSGEPRFEDARFVALGYQYGLRTPDFFGTAFGLINVDKPASALEIIAVKHRGLQTNSELAVAYHLGFGGVALGPVQFKPGLSWGLSYAFGTPTYEDGPKDDPERRYKLQSHLGIELALAPTAPSPWSVIAKVHHRSGIFGVIAPRRVGSNFLTLGLRYAY
jgi:hypothetical protein